MLSYTYTNYLVKPRSSCFQGFNFTSLKKNIKVVTTIKVLYLFTGYIRAERSILQPPDGEYLILDPDIRLFDDTLYP